MSDVKLTEKLVIAAAACGLLSVSSAVLAELRDPTRPSGFIVEAGALENISTDADELRLQAIFFHPDRPSALINGRRYAVGDEIADARIIQITSESVIFESEQQNKALKLSVQQVKTRLSSEQKNSRGGID